MEIFVAVWPFFCVLLATVLVYIGEKRVHSYNYAYLKAVSGEELIPRLMQRFYAWAARMPWVAAGSSLLMPASLKYASMTLSALFLIMLGLGLRLLTMRMLGRLWSWRCVFVPGMPRVQAGPFRLLRHPEYTGRVLEGLGLVLFFGANPLSMLFWLYGLLQLPKIVKTESRQLYELSVAPLHLEPRSSRVGSSE